MTGQLIICIEFVFLSRRPDDWTLSWGGSGTIYGWGHNHRGQLGGVEGAKVKVPSSIEALTALRPVQIVGGEQTLFAVTADGKVSDYHFFLFKKLCCCSPFTFFNIINVV